MTLDISDKVNTKIDEIKSRILVIEAKIATAEAGREALVAKKKKLENMLSRLNVIKIHSDKFDDLEEA